MAFRRNRVWEGTPQIARLALAGVLIALAASCSDEQPDSQPSSTTSQTNVALESAEDRLDSLLEGTAISFDPLDPDEAVPRNVDQPLRVLDLEGCRWRAPGLYSFDFSFEPTEPVSYPVEVPISRFVVSGPWDDTPSTYWGLARLDGPGDFSIPLDVYSQGPAPSWPSAGAGRRTFRDLDTFCFVQNQDIVGSELSIDPIVFAPGELGSLEELASTIDPGDSDANLLPIPTLVRQLDRVALDRLYLSPNSRLDHITVVEEDDCIFVRSTYEINADLTVFVNQGLRCEGVYPPRSSAIAVPDEVWKVYVIGPEEEATAVVADLQPFPLTGIEPFAPVETAFDPNAVLDARLSPYGDEREIARLPWRGGLVAAYLDRRSEVLTNIAVEERVKQLGKQDRICDTWRALISGDEDPAFLLIVTNDPSYQVSISVSGEEDLDVEMSPGAEGRYVALLDTADLADAAEVLAAISVRDAFGWPVPCYQFN